ncbi:MAG: MmgE/PrpD family protein [Acetobacteraceae bacterium]|nr:MmgE/PrpD family protein [Acetobacteraceae bacterium]MDW8397865.1 MmgE/PrpD family protein [Acetobacteraceae bacterium]
MTDTPLADALAALLAARWDPPLPPEVARRARLLLLDTVGCAIAGAAAPEVAALAEATMAGRRGSLRLPGFAVALDIPAAALLFATAACWDEACEGLARAHGRPGLHTLPAVLALGLSRGATLGAVLQALALGYEVAGRLGEVLRIRRGMHVDGTWGVFGAAAGAARMLGASAAEALDAVRIAALGVPASLYLPIRRGSAARNLYAGQAAERGIAAAIAAASGIAPPADALEEAARVAFGLDPAGLALAPPEAWLLPEGYLKPFAAVRHAHYPAAAAIALRPRLPADPGAIIGIRLRTYSEAIAYAGNRAPAAPITAQFSLSWATAHALRHGALGPGACRPEALADAATRRLEALVAIEADPARDAAGRRGASLLVRLADGRELAAEADSVPGDADRPMTEAETRAKVLDYARPVLGGAAAARLAEAICSAPEETPLAAVLMPQEPEDR